MSYTYAIQPPAGFGLLPMPTIGMRKRAAVPERTRLPGQIERPKVSMSVPQTAPTVPGSSVQTKRPQPAKPQQVSWWDMLWARKPETQIIQERYGKPGGPAGGVQPTPQNREQRSSQPQSSRPPAQGAVNQPPAASKPGEYDIFSRMRDIWDFIKHGMTLLWYRSGARKGTLTPKQWKSFQASASALGKNRTLSDLYNSWYGTEGPQRFNRFSQLGNVATDLQHLHAMKNLGYAGARSYINKNKLDYSRLKGTVDYLKRYGHINDADYHKYLTALGVTSGNYWDAVKSGWNYIRTPKQQNRRPNVIHQVGDWVAENFQ